MLAKINTLEVFLDISKAFDKVWHEGLIFKLKRNGVPGRSALSVFRKLSLWKASTGCFKWLSVWLENHWSWCSPRVCTWPLPFFLVYINNLPENILANMKLFADDSSLFNRVSDVNITQSLLENDLTTIQNWAHQWKMVFNPDITKHAIEIVFSVKNKSIRPLLSFNNVAVALKPFSIHLGLYMDETLSFSKHIREKIAKAMNGVSLTKFLSKYVS